MLIALPGFSAMAQETFRVADTEIITPDTPSDDVLRLPASNRIKEDTATDEVETGQQLVPGGVLFLGFDVNNNGEIDADEIDLGIATAFLEADANQSGYMTPIEQQSWAESLRPFDASLANPVRFDPNLDRRVSEDEFTLVIRHLTDGLKDEETGKLLVSSLVQTP